MKAILLLVILFAAAFAKFSELEYQSAFTFWMQEYRRSYSHDEFRYRFNVFKSNMDFVESHNKGKHTFTVGMNKFADLTNKEFAALFLGTKYTAPTTSVVSKVHGMAPTSVDWRTKGAVTEIKDQGQCGSCWSFSTTGSVEGCHFLSTGKLVSLSEQNLVDCSTDQGNQGCDGGLMTQAMDYIISNKGIDTEASYPYTAADGTCSFSASNIGATMKSYVNVNAGDEADLMAKVAMAPTSVAIDASHSSFQLYTSGVYSEPDCSTSQLDHGVLAVGYGSDTTGGDYWIVKNSWGTSWGMQGYIWMQRNKSNACGIATMATLPKC